MTLPVIVLLLRLATTTDPAGDVPPELKAVEGRFNQAELAKNETLREKYVNELAVLRWDLARHNKPDFGWQDVDAELARHPAIPGPNTAGFRKLRLGKWHSSRHDYLFKADGTWQMAEPGEAAVSLGNWAIKGNVYTETDNDYSDAARTYEIILLDKEYFIYGKPGTSQVYYEKRTLNKGLHIRRDDS